MVPATTAVIGKSIEIGYQSQLDQGITALPAETVDSVLIRQQQGAVTQSYIQQVQVTQHLDRTVAIYPVEMPDLVNVGD